MSRLINDQSTFNSQKGKLNILAEMLKISKSGLRIYILLLESPCLFVHPLVRLLVTKFQPHSLVGGSHGLSARRARRTESRGPKGL